MKYSKINVIRNMQIWMDSAKGQTFLNYAYSWGASIVILGTLFKLTHMPYADIMLYIGMGTEVVVFFLSGFERTFYWSPEDFRSPERDEEPGVKTLNEGQSDKLSTAAEELSTLVRKEKESVERMIEKTDACTEDLTALSENLRKIDRVAASVADALGGKR